MLARKKPVAVQVHLWDGDTTTIPDNIRNKITHFGGSSAFIETLEGLMEAREGDWFIVGVHGEVYPCKPDIFEKTYEIISE